MAAKLSNTVTPKFTIQTLMDALQPALLGFGPLIMVIGLQGRSNNLAWYSTPFSLVGCLMLSVGLIALFSKQRLIEARLDAVERLKS